MKTVSLSVSRPRSAKGSCLRNFRKNRAQQRLFANQQRRTFRPAGRDVGEHEGLDEAAASRRAAMGDEVCLNEAWRWIVPIPRRSNGNALSQGLRCGSRRGRPKPSRIGPSVLSIVAASSPAICPGFRAPGQNDHAAPSPREGQAATPSAACRRRGRTPSEQISALRSASS